MPWINTPAPQTSPATSSNCRSGGLRIVLGRVGAWHGRSVQALDLSNTSGMPCRFSPRSLSVTATTPAGRQVRVDTATRDVITLAAGQTVHVGLGAPAGCGSTPVIARTMQVEVAGGATRAVDKAWLPVNCGRPSVVQVDVEEPAPSAPEPVAATVHAPATVAAGSTLRFTVTLTNTSSSRSVTFADCPSYYTGLKVANVDRGYQLNCEVEPDLALGESRTYDMRMAVPDGAAGGDVLTWYLGGHATAASVPIDVR